MLIQADARAIPLRDGCVQCVVTSPPYFGLRDYGIAQQIGLEPTPEVIIDMTQVDTYSPVGPPKLSAGIVPADAEVWSLWDMFTRLDVLTSLSDQIRSMRPLLSRNSAVLDSTLEPFDVEILEKLVKNWEVVARNGGLEMMLATTERILCDLEHPMTYRDALGRLRQLEENLEDDAKKRWFVLLAKEKHSYFASTFGPTVDVAFPEAIPEIKEAHCCLALTRNTACVFHLMRAVEHGMRAMAIAVGITTPAIPLEYQQWNVIIEGIEKRTEKACDGWTDPAKSNGRAFFRRTVADLYAFKDETRNVLMHTRKGLYDTPGALSVRNRVEEFFHRLASKVKQDGSSVLVATLFLS